MKWHHWLLVAITALLLWVPVRAVADGRSSASTGLIQLESPYSVSETGDRLEAVLEERELTMFGRVDHGANAASVELALRPTEVIIFGNPMAGTPLMQCRQEVAIDLPQKMLIWEAADGQVHLGYNDPAYLQQRHRIEGCDPVLERIGSALGGLAEATVAPE